MSLLDSASLIVTPNGYKEGKLYSVIPSDGSGDMSVTRATTATRVNSAGLVELVPYNLANYSEQFDNVAWTQSGVTITSNSTTAPNGTTTADTIAFSSGSFVSQSYTHSGVHTFSIYAKYIGTQWLCVENYNNADLAAWFDIQNGVIGTIASGATANIENVGNGWYRCSVTMTANSAYTSTYATFNTTTNGGFTRTGSSYFWGAQVVEGSTALPYQKTETRLNIPRLDYSNGTCPSLLVEPQRTNVLQRSQEFENAYWINNGVTITANNTTAPDGALTADILTGVSGGFGVVRFGTWSATNNVASCFAKKNTSNIFRIANVTGTVGGVNFDLNSGVVSSVSAGFSATIEDFGNGWYRCTAVDTLGRTGTFSLGVTSASESVFIWGAQLESGSYSTSYIPTTSASVTRNADVISKTGISSLIGQTEGTLFVQMRPNAQEIGANLIVIGDGVNPDDFLQLGKVDTTLRATVRANNVSLFIENFNLTGDLVKAAIAYKNGDIAFYVNGALIASSLLSYTFISSLTSMGLGVGGFNFSNPTASNTYDLTALWKTRLTNDELERLTGTGFNTYAEMANYYNYITQ